MKSIFRQMVRFGIIGIAATFVHIAIALALVDWTGVPVLLANIIAFFPAFAISFLGNQMFTFDARGDEIANRRQLRRFVSLSVAGISMNQCSLWIAHSVLAIDHRIALPIIAIVVAALVFIGARYWSFRTPS